MINKREINLDEIVTTLKEGVHTIEFEKVDGTLRSLVGTLDPIVIGYNLDEDKPSKEFLDKEGNPKALPIWEMDPGQWRSFRLENMYKFNGDHVKYVESK